MNVKIVFSDIDGTLLNSSHKILPGTLDAIHRIKLKGIPFVIVSGRTPASIYPVLEEGGFSCPIICYSGGLILDEDRQVLCSEGFQMKDAKDVISFIEESRFDCSWNLYSGNTWIVRDRKDPRIALHEQIVRAQAVEASAGNLEEIVTAHKIFCICNPDRIDVIESKLRAEFPDLSFMRSSDYELEIVPKGVSKGNAVKWMCRYFSVDLEDAVAFGDHYNDSDMLEAVGLPILMGNAPEAMKRRFPDLTDDNDHEGIYNALKARRII